MRTLDRLRIAVQKSGRLGDPARELLARAGFAFRHGRDRLYCHGESLPVDLLLVRDDDIPGLLEDGAADFGVLGRNLLEERVAEGEGATAISAWRNLGFGRCRLSVAVPEAWSSAGVQALSGKRIATSYPRLLSRWLDAQGIDATPVLLSGSVEIAPRLGKADAICDLVSTGGTLVANQLKEVAVVLESEAVLAGPTAPFGDLRDGLAELLLRRLDGVLGLRATRLLMCQAPRAALPAIMELLDDAEAPTLTCIDGRDDAVSLQALCRRAVTWQRLEDIKRAGATGVLVLPIEQMLA